MGTDLRAAMILVGFNNPRIITRHATVRSFFAPSFGPE
jgi:hypothetical protein